MEFRLLKASEIDVRVGSVSKKGATLLLYKDARCDMAILDETVGPLNWQRHHSRDNANCTVAIWDEKKKQWVEKEDTGTESFTEKEKGLASDSFKRACFNVGIGRELYTGPRIFIPCGTQPKSGGRGYELTNPFEFYGVSVKEIDYKDRAISKLVLEKDGNEIFTWSAGSAPKSSHKPSKAAPPPASDDDLKEIERLAKEKNIPLIDICSMAGVVEIGELEDARRKNCIAWLNEQEVRA